MRPTGYPETSLTISIRCVVPDERRSHVHGGGILKSRQLCSNFPASNFLKVRQPVLRLFNVKCRTGKNDFNMRFAVTTKHLERSRLLWSIDHSDSYQQHFPLSLNSWRCVEEALFYGGALYWTGLNSGFQSIIKHQITQPVKWYITNYRC